MAEPSNLEGLIADAIGVLESASKRFPVERTGPRAPIPSHIRLLVLKRDRFRCEWCGANHPGQLFHLDHIVPWSAGGSDRTDNLRILCPTCNENRSNYRTDASYARRIRCTLLCRVCFGDDRDVADFDPDEIERVFCGHCNQTSWITKHNAWGAQLVF